jgi:hypothetical protein
VSIGAFADRKHPPTQDEMLSAIGPQLSAWQELIQFIRDTYPSDEDFKFLYGKKYGWALRFRIRGTLLTSLYPTQGGFTVQINLDPAAIEQVQGMKLGENVQQAIAEATPYPEGRWLFIPVESEADLQDVQQLLALRVATKRLQKDKSLTVRNMGTANENLRN